MKGNFGRFSYLPMPFSGALRRRRPTAFGAFAREKGEARELFLSVRQPGRGRPKSSQHMGQVSVCSWNSAWTNKRASL